MGSYISSYANRLYVKGESAYGAVPAISGGDRIPAVKLTARQQVELRPRRDKTGSRTFLGMPAGGRRHSEYELRTYLTTWSPPTPPAYSALFSAALGGAPVVFGGGVAAGGSTESVLVFAAPHGLRVGQGVAHGGEIRFVKTLVNDTTVALNAPLSASPIVGAALPPTVTFWPATDLPSVSIYDYWTPSTAVQRIVSGAAVNRLRVGLNGDYHEFVFSGPAQDIIDSASFQSGAGQLATFPGEPAPGSFEHAIVPGHLGQVWLGEGPHRFATVTAGSFELHNDVEVRASEFGRTLAAAVVPGRREVRIGFELFERDEAQTISLYQAAREEAPISVMFQLGQKTGQLCGLYAKKVAPETPQFDDDERRLKWRFRDGRAFGEGDDEVVVAFG